MKIKFCATLVVPVKNADKVLKLCLIVRVSAHINLSVLHAFLNDLRAERTPDISNYLGELAYLALHNE